MTVKDINEKMFSCKYFDDSTRAYKCLNQSILELFINLEDLILKKDGSFCWNCDYWEKD